MHQIPQSTMLEPQDLKFLQSCFDTIRRKHGLDADTRAATDVAAQIFTLYENGIRDRAELERQLSF